jgi:hypothetical protein
VLNGKVFACVNYSGDPLRFPYKHTIEELIDVFTQPLVVAYSLDVAVINTSIPSSLNIDIGNNGHFTRVIEVNDAYALGYYGGDVELYTKMLDLRWKEITATK